MKKTCIIFLILFSSQAKCANFGIDIWLDNPNLGGMGFEFSYGIDDSLGNNLFSESITTDSTNWDSFSRNITVSDVGKYRVWYFNKYGE